MKTRLTPLLTIATAFVGFALASAERAHAATTITVQSTGDGAATAGNCPGSGCTLRDALAKAADGDTIDFSVTGTITLTSGQLAVDKSITISGPGANMLAVNGAGASRVFSVTGNSVTISGLTITGGSVSACCTAVGGGIDTDSASLTVSNCTVSGNSAIRGGGIFNGTGQLTVLGSTLTANSGVDGGAMGNVGVAIVNNSTFSGNFASDNGGGIRNDATLTVNNSTFSGNSANFAGGGIDNFAGSLTINNSTVTGNRADLGGSASGNGGGIAGNPGTTETLNNTIVAGNFRGTGTTPDDINSVTIDTANYNLIGDASTSGGITNGTNGNIVGADAKLGPLAYYGGPTATHILKTGSPAIDKGDPNFKPPPNYDQRGFPFARVVNSRIDIGAFERQASDIDPTLVVTKTADTNDGTCDSDCSLREALAAAADGNAIYFAVTGTITLTNGHLLVDKSVTIFGPGADALAVNGNANGRVFVIGSVKTVSISGLTITNGSSPENGISVSGGGFYNDHATLTLSNCSVRGNSSTEGGGIFNDGGSSGSATLTIRSSTISGNSTSNGAAGIQNDGDHGGNATCTVENSTISGNSGGGAIINISVAGGSATMTIRNSTLSGNSSPNPGDIVNSGDPFSTVTMTIGSTIIKAGSSSSIVNSSGTITSLGYNLSSDGGVTNSGSGTGALNKTGDQTNTDPMLGPLQDNGGPTYTHALCTASGVPDASCTGASPAIDKGKNFSGATTDQRGPGFVRTVDLGVTNASGGDGTDIGAFEVQNTAPTITAETISQAQGTTSTNVKIATVSDNEDPLSTLTVTVTSTNPSHGVTISGISVDGSGNVTATVAASCTASNATFTLRVTDPGGLFDEDTLTVNVTANATPPVITLKPSPVLNTPNHKYHKFTVGNLVASATDDCDGNVLSKVFIVSASSDEPQDAKGTGDGSTLNDIVILSCTSLKVRAERADSGNGRVYEVNLRVTDTSGNVTNKTAKILVPNNGSAIDDGPSAGYTVTQPVNCP